MRQETRMLELNRYEHGTLIQALNDMRNAYIEEGKNIDFLNEVYVKLAKAPVKKPKGRWRDDAR